MLESITDREVKVSVLDNEAKLQVFSKSISGRVNEGTALEDRGNSEVVVEAQLETSISDDASGSPSTNSQKQVVPNHIHHDSEVPSETFSGAERLVSA